MIPIHDRFEKTNFKYIHARILQDIADRRFLVGNVGTLNQPCGSCFLTTVVDARSSPLATIAGGLVGRQKTRHALEQTLRGPRICMQVHGSPTHPTAAAHRYIRSSERQPRRLAVIVSRARKWMHGIDQRAYPVQEVDIRCSMPPTGMIYPRRLRTICIPALRASDRACGWGQGSDHDVGRVLRFAKKVVLESMPRCMAGRNDRQQSSTTMLHSLCAFYCICWSDVLHGGKERYLSF